MSPKSGKVLSRYVLLVCLSILTYLVFPVGNAGAQGAFYDASCAGCHGATRTCDGCHHHGPTGLQAQTNTGTHAPGAPLSVTFSGGSRGGWIRAILYLNNVEVARSTGTGSPPRGGAEFPITFDTTAPATPGTYTYQAAWFGNLYDTGNLTAANHGEQRVSTNQFTVSAPTGPTISTASPLPEGTVGTAYNQQLVATGGTPPLSWSVTAGSSLPAGLTLTTGGLLSGTPTTAGAFNFSITVSGGGTGSKAFALTINPAGVPDTTAPTVSATVPDNTATGVATNAAVTATFNEAIASGSVTASSFTLRSAVDNVTGTITVNGAVATFTPTAALADNTTYTATLTAAVEDLAGNNLAADYVWTFTTAAAVVAPAPAAGDGGGCAIAGSGGGVREFAGAFGALVLAAIGIGLRRRRKEK